MALQGNKKLFQAKASRVLLDGALVKIPGYEGTDSDAADQYAGDQFPFLFSGFMGATELAQESFIGAVPFDARIIAVCICIEDAITGTGGVEIQVGTENDADKFITGYTIATSLTSGVTQLITEMVDKSKDIDAGEQLYALNTGTLLFGKQVGITVICCPRNAPSTDD